MQPKQFLENLSSKEVIDETDFNTASARTRSLLQKADKVWEHAIANELKDKVTTVNGQTIIKPSRISETGARITEKYKDQVYDRPIVDLVQQGGGMYGIALAGYTYILEKAGIRFYSLGGTSAGGINAMLLGTLPNLVYGMESAIHEGRQASKSELLAHIIMNTSFHKFMDRGGIAGKLQSMLLKNMRPWLLKLLGIVIMVGLPITLYAVFGLILKTENAIGMPWTRTYDFVIGTIAAVVPLLLIYILFIRILGKEFGINTGDVFYKWMKDILGDPFVNVSTHEQLQQRLSQRVFDRQEDKESAKMVLITSNLTYNRIVKFPDRAIDYWEQPNSVNPAAYVRATMSIPFIFGTFIPDYRHVENNGTPKISKARFVDGGMLSNFPIREFHNNSIVKPRFPTFGVLLNESDIDLEVPPTSKLVRERFTNVTLLGYIGSFLSTFRNFYDNDFLRSSDEIKLRVVAVETKGFNWLDFWMKDEDKQALFEKGAQAAIKQLHKFDFENYLNYR